MIEINKYKLDPSSICLPGTVTTWGAIIGDITKQQDLVDYVAEHGGGGSAAEWGSITGDISEQTDLTALLSEYATQDWVDDQGYLVQSDLSQYATRQWVTGRGYATEHWVSNDYTNNVVTPAQEKAEANVKDWVVEEGYITSDALNGYATESWVEQQGYITSSALSWGNITGDISEQTDLNEELSQYVPWDDLTDTLAGYALQSWVQEQGYASSSDLTALASRVSTLETNYGDAITITNNILG